MKKSFLTVILSLSFVVFFSLSVFSAEFPGPDAAKIDWNQSNGQSIRVMACSRDAITYLKNIVPEFEKLTGIKVAIDDYPEAEFFRKIIIDLSSGNPVSDVFMLSHAYSTMYEAGGWLEPLEPYLENSSLTDKAWYDFEDYPAGSLSAVVINGKLYGIPIAPDNQIVFYRKDSI